MCAKCNVLISSRAHVCHDCVRKFEVTKEELHDLVNVQKMPYTQIGKLFGVTDNAIRRRCRAIGVEVRKRKKMKE